MKLRIENATNEDAKVVEWIDNNLRVRKESAVREALQPNDDVEVLKITIPMEESSDVLRWPHTHGRPSVQSTYHVIKGKRMESAGTP